jgi:hypothetical protein
MLRSTRLAEPEVESKGALLKRKDFLGVDERAHSHPNRTYYYRKNQDLDDIIHTCTKKLEVFYLFIYHKFSSIAQLLY